MRKNRSLMMLNVMLDVGCGDHPLGSVNCDLDVHRDTRPLNYRKIPNFVLCDVEYLPFKDGAFKEAVSNHVIEHIKDPEALFREMVRVSSKKIVIRCPHWLGDKMINDFFKRNKFHIQHFKPSWFYRAMEKYKLKGEVNISSTKYFPFII